MFRTFKIGDLFEGRTGDTDIKKEHLNEAGTFVVSSGVDNNGIIGKTDMPARIMPSHTLTVDMFGNCFYRDFEYKVVTHARVFTLVPKNFNLSVECGLYFVSILSWLKSAFSYNNMCSYKKIKNIAIQLPVTPSGDIDFKYMQERILKFEQERIAELEQERIAELDAYLVASGLDDYELTDDDESVLDETPMMVGFTASTLFDIKKGKRLTKANMVVGETPFVGSSSINNGITAYIGNTEHLHPGNTFTVSYNGSVGQVFLQDEVFWASDDVNVWYPKFKFSRESIQYIMAVVKKLGVRHNYTAKWTIDKMREEKLFLPVVESSNLDHVYTSHDIHWDYMERYIRAIEKLAIADVAKRKDRLIATTKQVVGM